MSSDLPTDVDAFLNYVLVRSIIALKANRFSDNFDARRFNTDGQDHANDFNAGEHAFYFTWILENKQPLFAAYECLEDAKSRELFLHLLMYRMAGHLSVKLPLDFSYQSDAYTHYQAREKRTPSTIQTSGMFGQLQRIEIEDRGHTYRCDGITLEPLLFCRQYFFAREGIQIMPEPGDVVIDGGACLGDSSVVFAQEVGPEGQVFAFDPVAEHQAMVTHNREVSTCPQITLVPYGLGKEDIEAAPIVLDRYHPGFNSETAIVPLRRLDSLVTAGEIPRVDFLKLDVEGAEMAALIGAAETIARFRPKLAISLYHKPTDLYQIVLSLRKTFPFYRFYLGHYTIHNEETVLYAVADALAAV